MFGKIGAAKTSAGASATTRKRTNALHLCRGDIVVSYQRKAIQITTEMSGRGLNHSWMPRPLKARSRLRLCKMSPPKSSHSKCRAKSGGNPGQVGRAEA